MSRKLWHALIVRAAWKRFGPQPFTNYSPDLGDMFELYRVHCRQTIWPQA